MISIDIPRGAAEVMNTLEKNGFSAYVVGGCVRDALLGAEPHDWDICTSALPEETVACFTENRVIKTGIKHGTVTVKADRGFYEVTTFRIDGLYKDNRRPENVKFVSDITSDLSRRDFTVNAMAYNRRDGLIDPFGGADDLKSGIIACVGNAEDRFSEDALRILRALRFASVLGFKIEEHTSAAVHGSKHLLANISNERIREELIKTIMGKESFEVLSRYSDVITQIIPELEPCIGFEQYNRYHRYNVYDHIMHAVANYRGNDPTVSLALLLHDVEKPACFVRGEDGIGHFYGHAERSAVTAGKVFARLKLDNESRHNAVELIKNHDIIVNNNKKSVKKWLAKLGEEQFMRLIEVKHADMLAQADIDNARRSQDLHDLRDLARSVIEDGECITLKQLSLKGGDLVELGLSGSEIGDNLRRALEAVVSEKVKNEKDALIDYLRIRNG